MKNRNLIAIVFLYLVFPFFSKAQCVLPTSEVLNTGSNMTVMFTESLINSLDITDENAYLVALNEDGLVVGSLALYGVSQISMAVWADDTSTSEVDGATPYESITFQLVNGLQLFDVAMPLPVSFVTNGLAVQTTSAISSLNCDVVSCDLPIPYTGNTGNEMTVMLSESFVNSLNYSNENVYLVAFSQEGLVVGSQFLYPNTTQTHLTIWGDDSQTGELDGAMANETISFQLVDGDGLFDVDMPTPVFYVTNNLVYQNSIADLTLVCDPTPSSYCDLPPPFEGNTGSNMTVMLTPPFISSLNVTNPDAYLVALSADGSVVGSELVAGISLTSMSVWGDDPSTDETDGALAGEAISFQLVDGELLFDVTMPTPVSYNTNSIVPQFAAAVLTDVFCVSGCTNSLACNFNSLATQDDGSCSIPGCTDNNYIEYFNQGFEAGCADGSCSIEVKDFNLSPQNFQVQNITGNSMNIGFNSLNISNIESASIGAFYDLNGDGIINTDTYTNDNGQTYSECVGLTDFNVDEFFTLALWGDNTSTNEVDGLIEGQSEVIFAILTQNNQVIVFDLLPEFPSYSSNGIIVSNGIELDVRLYGCTDPSYCSYDPNAEEDDGSCNGIPGCLDLFYTEYDIDANCNKQELCIVSWQDAYNSSQDDNVTLQNQLSDLSFELNVLNNQFTDSVEVLADLRNELEVVNSELTYWYNPIEINLAVGWNIIGYSIPEPQDVVATVQEINDIIVIIKNNAAEVYWPEFGFNGIGDFLPGQGYQINVSENYNGFSYPETQGQRFDLVPTVPDWAIDMEVELHPNDIRTLVRVVNMLGQEVNPESEPKGTVLLYLYNDATVEKKLTK